MKEINMFRKIKKNFKLILYSTFLWGIFAHGMMIFNKFSYHDDAGFKCTGTSIQESYE